MFIIRQPGEVFGCMPPICGFGHALPRSSLSLRMFGAVTGCPMCAWTSRGGWYGPSSRGARHGSAPSEGYALCPFCKTVFSVGWPIGDLGGVQAASGVLGYGRACSVSRGRLPPVTPQAGAPANGPQAARHAYDNIDASIWPGRTSTLAVDHPLVHHLPLLPNAALLTMGQLQPRSAAPSDTVRPCRPTRTRNITYGPGAGRSCPAAEQRSTGQPRSTTSSHTRVRTPPAGLAPHRRNVAPKHTKFVRVSGSRSFKLVTVPQALHCAWSSGAVSTWTISGAAGRRSITPITSVVGSSDQRTGHTGSVGLHKGPARYAITGPTGAQALPSRSRLVFEINVYEVTARKNVGLLDLFRPKYGVGVVSGMLLGHVYSLSTSRSLR